MCGLWTSFSNCRVQAKVLQIFGGAFCTTLIRALLIDMEEMRMEVRQYKTGLKCLMKLKGPDETFPTKQIYTELMRD